MQIDHLSPKCITATNICMYHFFNSCSSDIRGVREIQLYIDIWRYIMAHVTSCNWLLTWQDFSAMTAGIMKIVNAL